VGGRRKGGRRDQLRRRGKSNERRVKRSSEKEETTGERVNRSAQMKEKGSRSWILQARSSFEDRWRKMGESIPHDMKSKDKEGYLREGKGAEVKNYLGRKKWGGNLRTNFGP